MSTNEKNNEKIKEYIHKNVSDLENLDNFEYDNIGDRYYVVWSMSYLHIFDIEKRYYFSMSIVGKDEDDGIGDKLRFDGKLVNEVYDILKDFDGIKDKRITSVSVIPFSDKINVTKEFSIEQENLLTDCFDNFYQANKVITNNELKMDSYNLIMEKKDSDYYIQSVNDKIKNNNGKLNREILLDMSKLSDNMLQHVNIK